MSVSKFINKIGLELEGGWFRHDGFRGLVTMDNYSLIRDSSIELGSSIPKRFWGNDIGKLQNLRDNFHIGELVSNPYNSLEEAENLIKECWPDITNTTCGFHIHLSFNKPSYYSCLMDSGFYDYFRSSLYEFMVEHKLGQTFRDRFDGHNRFCLNNFDPDAQAYTEQKYHPARYYALNFCYGLHKTMEVRVFNAVMPRTKAVKALRWFVKCVDSYLENNFAKAVQEPICELVTIED